MLTVPKLPETSLPGEPKGLLAPTETPSPTNLLMAAAEMHRQGKFKSGTGPVPEMSDTEKKKMWTDMPEADFRNIVRKDVERNRMDSPIWRDKEYNKIWDEEKKKYDENEKMFKMSPKQLREHGVKP